MEPEKKLSSPAILFQAFFITLKNIPFYSYLDQNECSNSINLCSTNDIDVFDENIQIQNVNTSYDALINENSNPDDQSIFHFFILYLNKMFYI